MRRALTTLAAAAIAAAPSAANARIDKVTGPIPYGSTAEIYSPGGLPGTPAAREIAEAGYVEEEYFITGEGDAYRSGDALPVLDRSGIPFTTRVLVIRPRDPAKFNGVVHITGMHPFQGSVQWNWASHLVMTSGAAYVAVGTGTDANSRSQSTAETPIAGPWITKWFDSDRYAAIDWPEEDGIRWTVLSDVAHLLRSKDRTLLADLGIRNIYMSGWSFLGSFQRTYINEGFHDLFRQADGKPLIDGYLIGISSPWQRPGYLPINAHDPAPPIGSARRRLRPIDVPVIEFLSQNEAYQNGGAQAPDRDSGKGRHRLYELGGTTHRDLGVEVDRSQVLQLRARNHPGGKPDAACAYPISDVPLRLMFAAAMDNLDRWVNEGTPPPPGARLSLDGAQNVAHDAHGNPMGGVRNVQLDVPLARYGMPPARECANFVPQYILMRRIPFDRATLDRLYPGGKTDYLAKAEARLKRMIAERWLRSSDEPLYRAQIEAAANAAFGS